MTCERMSGPLLEARPFRPFKSSEEYLYAMKEDLAEWFQTLYPHLRINVENFMDRLETGVALCEHANAVKVQAAEYVQKKQARKIMTRSVTGSLFQAQTLIEIADVKFFATAKPGTFFARDNVSNFIHWCRQSLQILECLLFESDDLILRKNEKHVILCLLEVARRGARFGMLAPMLVQMERQIDREIAADQRAQGNGNGDESVLEDEDTDSEMEDEQLMLTYGPLPQIVTNDLKSLDEMVRDLVAQCTCPTQFPMIRVSEGKYRIGDTKVLIFVRILRNHVMVRVGGGWDTLAHYLDKHDPCRCRAQHRTTQSARLVNKPGAMDLAGAQVYYERTPNDRISQADEKKNFLSLPGNDRGRSRSPSTTTLTKTDSRRSASPNLQRKSLAPPINRSRSPTPNFTSTHHTKLSMRNTPRNAHGPQSLPYIPTQANNVQAQNNQNSQNVQNAQNSPARLAKHANAKNPSHIISSLQIPVNCKSEAALQVSDHSTDHSDTSSQVSDEGYRSLGIVSGDKKNRNSLYSQNSAEDAEFTEHQDIEDVDDTNDMGLRRTHFSANFYKDNPDVPKNLRPQVPPPKLPGRSNSVDIMEIRSTKIPPCSPRKSLQKQTNHHGSLNGKSKSARPSLATDTFTSPFNRTSPARRSIASFQPVKRGSQSATTSPTKLNLKQELINAAKQNVDDSVVIEEVHKLLRQYVSQNGLNEFDDIKKHEDQKNSRMRKDSKSSLATRIPAPVSSRVSIL